METIAFTKVALPYGWFGNMSPHSIIYMGKEWRTSEALFQALRFNDETLQERIRLEKSPMGAKMRAKGIVKELTETNELYKRHINPLSVKDVDNMMLCVSLKLEQHPELKQQLLDTGDSIIIEDCTSRGKRGTNLFWGMVFENEWIGNNMLGRIWMKKRDELNQAKMQSTGI